MREEKNILVTGATSGIGRECAARLSRAGHRVFATGRNGDALEELRRELSGTKIETLRLDVTDPESVRAAAQEVNRRTNGYGLDVLVNNAGYGAFGPLEELPPEALRAQFETNVFGLVAVTNAFLPPMKKRRQGRIINISSLVGRISLPFQGAYNATKFALEALSDAQRLELIPFGVRVVLVEPGAVRSNFERTMIESVPSRSGSEYAAFTESYASLVRKTYSFAVSPQVIARCVERAIKARRPCARYMSPAYIRLLVFFKAVKPTFAFDLIIRLAVGLWKKNIR